MITNGQLIELIDHENLQKMERYAGGHDGQMKGLFVGATVRSHWNEGGYQGSVATAVKLSSGEVVMYNDYYGSCSGCDSWENANDDDVRTMCIQLASTAKIFNSEDEAKAFLTAERPEGRDFNWSFEVRYGLLEGWLQ
jgi:hypothetical protein